MNNLSKSLSKLYMDYNRKKTVLNIKFVIELNHENHYRKALNKKRTNYTQNMFSSSVLGLTLSFAKFQRCNFSENGPFVSGGHLQMDCISSSSHNSFLIFHRFMKYERPAPDLQHKNEILWLCL